MKLWFTFAVVLVVLAAHHGGAQSTSESRAQNPQALGFWVDPSTGLMWAGKDNGEDVNWKNAVKYCRDLRLAGYSDWRLASLGELQGIYDKNSNAPGLAGMHGEVHTMWHVKGNLFLTGNQWSDTRIPDDRGHPSGYAYRFDFNEGQTFDGDELYFHSFKRALCVRTPGKSSVQSH